MTMEMSAIGKAALLAREGRRLKAYRDSRGIWTIGNGCTVISGRPVRSGDVITSAECDALFVTTLVPYVAAVNRGLKVVIGQNAFDALVSICYNIGIAGFLGSTFLRRINAGGTPGDVAAAIMAWRKPPEIVDRRAGEVDQFLTPYDRALPKARRSDKATVSGVVLPAAREGGQLASVPVIEPVHVPPSWLARAGAWVDSVWGAPPAMPSEVVSG